MKIISLNTWRGDVGREAVLGFLKREAVDTDVFCLQEVWWAPEGGLDTQLVEGLHINTEKHIMRLGQEVADELSDFQPFFHSQLTPYYGLMMLVHKNWQVINSGEIFTFKDKSYIPPPEKRGVHARNIQYVTFETPKGVRTVINIHGIWDGASKADTPDRLRQSEIIVEFLQTLDHPFVFCGDFNLEPDTESIKMFEAIGLQNLIRENGITSTRTSYYTYPEKFADYAFVSPELIVTDFKVLPDEVSDHAPLSIEVL